MVDTNSDPNKVDFPIPGNDDAYKSVETITKAIGRAIEEGLQERKTEKEERDREKAEQEKIAADKAETKKEEA